MELVQQLMDLKKNNDFNKDAILKITTVEMLFYKVLEIKMSKEPNYNNLYSLFDTVRDIMFDNAGINIFEEFITIKYYYLNSMFEVDTILLDALLEIIGPVLLDYELERQFFKDDEFYAFYLNRYNQFKQNNELTVLKIMNRIDLKSFKLEGEELQKTLAELKTTAGLQ